MTGPHEVLPTAPSRDAREHAIAALTRHFAEDRLSLEEFDRRAELAFSVATVAELEGLTADVGGAPTTPVEAPGRLRALFSSQERSGPAIVPRRQELSCIFGSVELDLRQATFAPGDSVIDLSVAFGSVEITVPADVRIELDAHAAFGAISTGGSANAPPGAPVVLRIVGRVTFGSVEIGRGRFGAPSAFLQPRP